MGSCQKVTLKTHAQIGDPAFASAYFYMSGTSAIFSDGACLAADDPLDKNGDPVETLIVASI